MCNLLSILKWHAFLMLLTSNVLLKSQIQETSVEIFCRLQNAIAKMQMFENL